jgi:hypothetical protein
VRYSFLGLAAVLACGGSPTVETSVDASESGSGTSGGDGATTDGGTDESAGETGDTDEAEAGDGDGDVGSGDGDGTSGDGDGSSGDGDGDGACPPPETVLARFWLDPPAASLDTICAVAGESVVGSEFTVTFDCGPDGTITLGAQTTLAYNPPPFPANLPLSLTYRTASVGPNQDRWLAIHDMGGLLRFGAIAATSLDPPGLTNAAFFGGLGLTEAEPTCAPESDSCGDYDRLWLDVDEPMFGPTGRVHDHGSFFVDFLAYGWSIEVEEATRRLAPVGCDDVPQRWFQLVAEWFPSD